MNVRSPITKSSNVEKLSSFESSITSDSNYLEFPVSNWLCLDSGIIFNASGTRGEEASFFMDEYDLHSESAYAEFKYYESGKTVGLYTDITNFISHHLPYNEKGSAIDIGCGKGLLLKELKAKLVDWDFFAVEPSKNALKYFKTVLPNVDIHNGLLEGSPFIEKQFDLVMANGVLEHVPEPLTFLKRLRNMLSRDGYMFIGVPNFVNNPADLLTFDHLSKLTPTSIKFLFKLAGLTVVAEACPNNKVPMWFLLKAENKASIQCQVNEDDLTRSRTTHAEAFTWLNDILYSYQKAVEKAGEHSIAMYGTGTVGQYAFGSIKGFREKVNYIFDDNSSLWGTKKAGVEIYPLERSEELPFSQLVFSANPCYQENMLKKAQLHQDTGKFDINEP